jgi:hypothetical protein
LIQVLLGLLEDRGFVNLAEDEQQDDRAETTAYAVEEFLLRLAMC